MQRKTPFQAAALAGAPVSTAAVAQGDPGYYGHMMGWGTGMLWGPLAWIFWLAIVVVVVLVVLKLTGGRGGSGDTGEDESLRILKNRYARGEITKDKYEEMRRDLER